MISGGNIRTNSGRLSIDRYIYFAEKFADFAGMYMGFFAVVLLALLFIRDTRKDTYELLHTKSISAKMYICGKVLGGMAAILLALAILNVVFIILSCAAGIQAGFPVGIWDIPVETAILILPNMLMIVCVYTVIALLFKNPLNQCRIGSTYSVLFGSITFFCERNIGYQSDWTCDCTLYDISGNRILCGCL